MELPNVWCYNNGYGYLIPINKKGKNDKKKKKKKKKEP